ncbi:MAG: efflux RND transporter periplasmic adaptor subunit [Rhodospirillales bacterium]|nr:efflux RND transporter periplasmic adaptor subunit [Rhodospirillales bacterium]MDE2576449.1 efflux RND transporter periplasmic adaptor subunit [Rhodospirillales bacterium]
MSRQWRLVLLGVAAVAGAFAVPWLWPPVRGLILPAPPAAAIDVAGNIEAHESVLSFTQVAAPIVALPFDEGAHVAAGTVLARVDDRLYQQQVGIDEANLAIAEAQVTVATSTLAASRHSVTSDQYDVAQKQQDYVRAQALARTHVVSDQARDLAFTAAAQAAANLAHDQAMARVAEDNVGLARATLAASQARLRLDQVTLSYAVLRAPFDGVIAVREAELGELAGPGVAVVTLDDLDHVWLRAYVNEPDLGKVRLGEPADVTTDTYPGHIYHGRISFISPQAEFTPKTVQTHAERVTLVYRIRIDIDNPTHELLPGMPADARIARLPAAPK